VRPQGEERKLFRLPCGRLGQLSPAVADLHGEQTRQPVQVALAFAVPDPDALAADHDGRSDAGAMSGEVAPQVAIRLGRQVLRVFDDRHRVPQLYCCLTNLRYTSVSVATTPGSARILVLSKSRRSPSSSQTTSAIASNDPAVSTT